MVRAHAYLSHLTFSPRSASPVTEIFMIEAKGDSLPADFCLSSPISGTQQTARLLCDSALGRELFQVN